MRESGILLVAAVVLAACASGNNGQSKKYQAQNAKLETAVRANSDRIAKLERKVAAKDASIATLEAKMMALTEGPRRRIAIDLPTGQGIDPGSLTTVVVDVLGSGRVSVNGRQVTAAELDTVFRGAYARDKTTQVIVRPQTSTPHAAVVSVVERAKLAGLTRLAIATRGN